MSAAAQRTLAMLHARGAGRTLCPSEVARDLAGKGGDWRARMEEVHGAVDQLLDEGEVTLSWKGQALQRREGPYRIAPAAPHPNSEKVTP